MMDIDKGLLKAVRGMQKGKKYRVTYRKNDKVITVDGIYDGLNFSRIYLKNMYNSVSPVPIEEIETISEYPA